MLVSLHKNIARLLHNDILIKEASTLFVVYNGQLVDITITPSHKCSNQYSICLKNNKDTSIKEAKVQLNFSPIPALITYDQPISIVDYTNGNITFNIGDLLPHESKCITFRLGCNKETRLAVLLNSPDLSKPIIKVSNINEKKTS